MLSREFLQSPRAIPVAIAFVNAGLVLVIVNLLWPRPIAALISLQWQDFARGFVLGIAISIEAAATVFLIAAAAAQRAAGSEQDRKQSAPTR